MVKNVIAIFIIYTVVLPSIRQCMYSIPCGCINKGVSFLLPSVDYYLKGLCNTIIKFKGMFACYRCFVAPYNLFIMAYPLYVLWLTGSVSACSQDLMHVNIQRATT